MTAPESFVRAQAAHFAALDPLLPTPVLPHGGEPLGALNEDRKPLLALLREESHPPGTASSLWSARVCQQLYPLVASGTELDPLLRRWRELLDDRRDPGVDSACLLTWPSRDIEATQVLLRHGFVPLTVLAVRAGSPAGEPWEDGTPVRRAGEDDLPDLLELAMAELQFAARVGSAVVREDAERLKATALRDWLDDRFPMLLAERDGEAAGTVQFRAALLDEDSRPRLLPDGLWGYVNCLSVHQRWRASGVGRALMARAHAELPADRMGDYLYYNPANPLSSVFWPRQGYRPLWTVWEVRPARALQ